MNLHREGRATKRKKEAERWKQDRGKTDRKERKETEREDKGRKEGDRVRGKEAKREERKEGKRTNWSQRINCISVKCFTNIHKINHIYHRPQNILILKLVAFQN